jgi:hypothetical protein
VDGTGPVEPGLDVLLGLLTSGPAPDDLAGESTALEIFRASQRPAAGVSVPVAAGAGGLTGCWCRRAGGGDFVPYPA